MMTTMNLGELAAIDVHVHVERRRSWPLLAGPGADGAAAAQVLPGEPRSNADACADTADLLPRR